MSYQVPQDYPSLPSMAIPHALVGDDIKQFKGARNITKYLPSASGSVVGPNSSLLFTIPAEPYGYIKPNSMYLRGKVTIAGQLGHRGANFDVAGAGQVAGTGDVASSFISFAGNTFAAGSGVPGATYQSGHGTGGASSVFNRFTVTLPGGCAMSYNQQQHHRNAVTPHTLDSAYFTDLRIMESAGCTWELTPTAKVAINANVAYVAYTKEVNFCTPVDIPLFNADAAFPMLLCSQGITMEVVTSSLADALYHNRSAVTGINNNLASISSVSTYSLSDLALVYEVIQVTPEFKNALVASKAGSPYVIHVDDRMVIGPIGVTATSRVNVGVGLSSLKSVLFTEHLLGDQTVQAPKYYPSNGTTSYNVYRDGQQISIPNLTSEDICFMEMQRAIGRMNDSNTTSMVQIAATSLTSGKRTTYTDSGFLLGTSFQCIDDWSFSARGAGCDQLAVELIKGVQDAPKWSSGAAVAPSNLYIFCMYDSIVVILGDGTCQVRK
jgi:hypothetical protein